MDAHFLTSVSSPDQAPGLRRIALALDLPEDADEGAIVARIEAVRLLRRADSLHQVRAALGLAASATPLDCAAELCRRLPAGYAPAVIVAMQCVEANERLRQARVALICADAIREARDAR